MDGSLKPGLVSVIITAYNHGRLSYCEGISHLLPGRSGCFISRHDSNMTRNSALMLKTSLRVLRSQQKTPTTACQSRAIRGGVRFWRTLYGDRLVRDVKHDFRRREWRQAAGQTAVLARFYPRGFVRLITLLVLSADRPQTHAAS
jgi:hypothetical protein